MSDPTLPAHLFRPQDSPPAIQFRPVVEDDLFGLHHACYAQRPFDRFKLDFPGRLRRQATGKGLWLVAVQKEAGIIGAAQLIHYGVRAEIADLFVTVPFRGQGIGSTIITILTAVAHYQRLKTLEISVDANNEGALVLYQRLGFIEERRRQLPGGAEAIVLYKSLTE